MCIEYVVLTWLSKFTANSSRNLLRTKFQLFSYFGDHFTPSTFLLYLSNIGYLLNCVSIEHGL